MINSLMKAYTYSKLGTTADSYGQEVYTPVVGGSIRISINLINKNVNDNILYEDATYIGLTYDSSIDDTYIINYGNEKLKVLYVNATGRIKQVYLARA